jgi:hypothetical protein
MYDRAYYLMPALACIFVCTIMLGGCQDKSVGHQLPDSGSQLPWQDGTPSDSVPEVEISLTPDASTSDVELELPGIDTTSPPPPGCADAGAECGTVTPEGSETLFCGNCPEGQWCTPALACLDTPSCGPGGFAVRHVRFSESGDKVPVGPQTAFYLLLEWEAANAEACNWCSRSMILSAPEDPFGPPVFCTDLGPVAACPQSTTGLSIVSITDGLTDTTGLLLAALLPPGLTCEDGWATQDFTEFFDTGGIELELALEVPCPSTSCQEIGRQCDYFSPECGPEIFCGHCPPGHICEQGICQVAPLCTTDELSITGALLNGFSQETEASPGEEVLVLFSWSLSGAMAFEDHARQLVVGIGNKAGFCADIGLTQTCPGLSTGIISGSLAVPYTEGIYALEAAVMAADDCEHALAVFAGAFPRQTMGSVLVSSTCTPADCQQLSYACGHIKDGCGSTLACGTCTPPTFCQQGSCLSEPACQDDSFTVLSFALAGETSETTVSVVDSVPFSLQFQAATGAECPTCDRQVVLYAGDTLAACAELEEVPACPKFGVSWIGDFLSIPPASGSYSMTAALVAQSDCDSVPLMPQGTGTTPVGTLTVNSVCNPFTCENLSKECSDWGDGCGGFLHCGLCPEETTCSSAGTCDNPCAQGIFEVTGLSINGSGLVASSPPGKPVVVNMGYNAGNPEICPECPLNLVFGLGNTAMKCEPAGNPPVCPATSSGSINTHIDAPASPGAKVIYTLPSPAATCDDAMASFPGNPDRIKLGLLHVTDGCEPQSCISMGIHCGDWEDGCDNTLNCGLCPPTQLCNMAGDCICSWADEYEPNNSAGNPYSLGAKTDHDASSQVTIIAAVQQEADWYHIEAQDKQWAFLEPYIHIQPGNPDGFSATVVYRCLDGTFPSSYNELFSSGCELVQGITLAGLGQVDDAWECQPVNGLITLQFGAYCALLDDSGDLFVGVSNLGACTAYQLDLHL